jgi:thiol:disulfide interchange protein DsbD
LLTTPIEFAYAASSSKTEQLDVELISESAAAAPGSTVWLGLRLKHAPGWHTYWINPGDSGLPTKLKWTLPAGYSADDFAWPAPKRFSVSDIANFGYDGDALLPIALHVPADAKSGSRANIAVDARWLVCHEECIPGRAALTLDLPISAQTRIDPSRRAAFTAARNAQPQGSPLPVDARDKGSTIEVRLPRDAVGDAVRLDAFAVQTKVVANAQPAVAVRDTDTLLTFAKSDYFTSIPDALDLVVIRANAPAIRAHASFAAPAAQSKPLH